MGKKGAVIHHRLTPAAAVYREKLLLRQRSDLPGELVELPAFDFKWPVRNPPEDAEKNFLKSMIRLIGYALMELPMANVDHFQFVSLVQVGFTRDTFRFHFMCPYPEVVHNVLRAAERAKQKTEMTDMHKDLEIRHKYGIPADVRVPLVFDYRHNGKQLLAINENHINNPNQFLDPAMCRTTSGLLNFLGAISILEAMTDDLHFMNDIVSNANTLMDQNLDEWLRWLYELTDRGVTLNQSNVLVDPISPEKYYYNYSAGIP